MGALDGLAEALRRLRGTDSQGALARRAGISMSAIQRAEGGIHRPSAETLDAILTALGKDAHDLADALDVVNGRTSPEPAPTLAPPTIAEARELLGGEARANDLLAQILGLAAEAAATRAKSRT